MLPVDHASISALALGAAALLGLGTAAAGWKYVFGQASLPLPSDR